MADMNIFWETSKSIMRVTNPLTYLVVDAAQKAIGKSNAVTETGDIDEMKKEALRQEIISRM